MIVRHSRQAPRPLPDTELDAEIHGDTDGSQDHSCDEIAEPARLHDTPVTEEAELVGNR